MDFSSNDLEGIRSCIIEAFLKTHSDTAVNLWFGDIKLISIDEREAVFVSPTDVKKNIIMKKFSKELEDCLENILGFRVEVVVYSSEHGEVDLSAGNIENFKKIEHGETVYSKDGSKIDIPGDYRSEYTFENFIVGSSNKFAFAMATAIAVKDYDHPEKKNTYNPLFIYGPSGVGKTHLLYAITNSISHSYPDKKITYVKGEEFTNQLIDSLQKKTNIQFREKYRKSDVLLIDDIQFVAGRISTQEELFNTFNAIYEDNKQIILTSDRSPNEMKTLEDRLRTRFMSGIICDIQLPDFDLRLAILQQKAKQNNLFLPPDVLRFLAENITTSIRQLEGVIKKLGAIQLLEGGELNIERVKNAVKEFIPIKESDTQKMDNIIFAVSKKFGVTRDDILSSKRNKEVAIARHVCVYIARTTTSLSQAQVGKALNRDRTTVISSENFVKEEMEKDSSFAMEVKEAIREVNGQ